MLDASIFLGRTPDDITRSAELVGEVLVESIEDETYGEVLESGISFVVGDDGRISTVHLHADGHEDCVGYAGAMPNGIRFDMSRARVRAMLGRPDASGEPTLIPNYGPGPAWDRFGADGAQVHVQYADDQRSITLVTLTTRPAVPGRTYASTNCPSPGAPAVAGPGAAPKRRSSLLP